VQTPGQLSAIFFLLHFFFCFHSLNPATSAHEVVSSLNEKGRRKSVQGQNLLPRQSSGQSLAIPISHSSFIKSGDRVAISLQDVLLQSSGQSLAIPISPISHSSLMVFDDRVAISSQDVCIIREKGSGLFSQLLGAMGLDVRADAQSPSFLVFPSKSIPNVFVGLSVQSTGAGAGPAVGFSVGLSVGFLVGLLVGFSVGLSVGFSVGFTVGLSVGFSVGLSVGFSVGFSVGLSVGFLVGLLVGFSVGLSVGFSEMVGPEVGEAVGEVVGVRLGTALSLGAGL